MPDPSHKPSETQDISNRSSIDLSLELEQQLDSESLPPDSPRVLRRPNHNNGGNRTSFDPHVLAHIVSQLRDSLTSVSEERDELVHRLAESHSREAEFKDSLALCSERCASLEHDLKVQRKKNQDHEEAIVLLRSKVEESRRGLMRLQSQRNAETKRMTLDLTHARAATFGGPRSTQRASFTPLTGSGQHAPSSFRRTSSTTVAENDPGFAEFVEGLPNSVGGQTLVINDSADHNVPNRRRSMLGNRVSSLSEGRASPSNAELDSLKQELATIKAELEDTRHELSESNEAREASETCLKVLREFIGQSDAGGSNVQLPPLPSDSQVRNAEPEPKPKGTGWGGLKLWRADTGISPSSASNVSRKSVDSYRTASSEGETASPSTAVPLRTKFGSFFTRGTSVSSVSHSKPQPNQDQSAFNGSDVSSSTEEHSEPTSPAIERIIPVLVQESPTGATRDVFPHEPGHEESVKVDSL